MEGKQDRLERAHSLSRMTTTVCLLPPTSPNHHLYLPKHEAERTEPSQHEWVLLAIRIERIIQVAVPQPLPTRVFLIRGLLGLGHAQDEALEGAGEPVTSALSPPPPFESLAVATAWSQWAGTLPPSFLLRL